jgi:thiamine-monophosphate kinase
MADRRPHEFALIKRFFAPLATDPGSLDLIDDAAVLAPACGVDLVLTKDVLAEGVHFFAEDPPDAIAQKALRVNLSDLAAKGARPKGYLLGLALREDWTEDWLEGFCAGLASDQSQYDVVLLGGDTIRSGNGLQVSITAIGEVPEGRAVRRAGAGAGDILFATGSLGDGAAGLQVRLDEDFAGRFGLDKDDVAHLSSRYLLPRPRVEMGEIILEYASAAMDVSDGLFADAAHLARASRIGLQLDVQKVPVSPALGKIRQVDPKAFAKLINGGDDYELLACVPANKATAFEAAARSRDCGVTRIGTAVEGEGAVVARNESGDPVPVSIDGFRHF